MIDLKNKIVGFIDNTNKEEVLNELRHLSFIKADSWQLYSSKQAQEAILEKESTLNQIKRSIQKHIGGGLSEFLRDVEEIDTKELLLVVDVNDLNEQNCTQLKDSLKQLGVKKLKHIGHFAIEHVTTEPGHREETPLIK